MKIGVDFTLPSCAPTQYLKAARCPEQMPEGEFGLWRIRRITPVSWLQEHIGGTYYTALYRTTIGALHHDQGECVMEDSFGELRQHLPIWLRAHGRVLVTGLGLGCVVRGLLANPDVDHLDVIEIDRQMLDRIGPEFEPDPRVTLIHGDALKHPVNGSRWDFAWHDLWTDESEGEPHLQIVHAELLMRYGSACGRQGAWKFPRYSRRLWECSGHNKLLCG